MAIRMDLLNRVIAKGLDIVENELFGASEHHGLRVAILCAAMGRRFALNNTDISALTTCAIFHDNALTEYILSERSEGKEKTINLQRHCQYGQRNMETLPFKTSVEGLILYHHERPDGNGPFRKKAGEFPLGAELIAIADAVDVDNHLQRVSLDNLPNIRREISRAAGIRFTSRAAHALLGVFDEKMLLSLRNENIVETSDKNIPAWLADEREPEIIRIAELVAHVIDYKSVFTKKHTVQIANRAWLMGNHYGYKETELRRLFLAAALHDIGKLAVPSAILEKPGSLDKDEFEIIKNHVLYTYEWLHEIKGFEDVCAWAANHHEKLDGKGYPFGKNASELDFNSRMMACIDIYQAVSEERPYHPRRNHTETMPILYTMAQKKMLDEKIVCDMDKVMLAYDGIDVPLPEDISGCQVV